AGAEAGALTEGLGPADGAAEELPHVVRHTVEVAAVEHLEDRGEVVEQRPGGADEPAPIPLDGDEAGVGMGQVELGHLSGQVGEGCEEGKRLGLVGAALATLSLARGAERDASAAVAERGGATAVTEEVARELGREAELRDLHQSPVAAAVGRPAEVVDRDLHPLLE